MSDTGGITWGEVLPFLSLLFAFLVGSIPFRKMIGRFLVEAPHEDLAPDEPRNRWVLIRQAARNSGFTRNGFLIAALDALKGAIPVLILGYSGVTEEFAGRITPNWIWACGLFAVLGHCYSPWLHFKGGKGIGPTLGVVAVLSPYAAAAGLLGYAVTLVDTRLASLASLFGVACALVAYLVLHPIGAHLVIGAALIFVVLMRHEGNIDALLDDREKRLP